MAERPRNQAGHESRLDHFRACTVTHPRLMKAKAALMNAVNGAEPNSLVFVFGPTGVGKTFMALGTINASQQDKRKPFPVKALIALPETLAEFVRGEGR